jgi:Tfp pilus assembly protein PilZ
VKQYTSKFLKTVAAFFIVFPVGYIVFAAMLFDIPLNACASILLSPFYYVVSLTAVAAGYGLWEMRRWSWYLFVVSQILIFYETALFVSNYAESHHKGVAFLFSFLIQLGLVYRVGKEIRVPYLFPRIRWWESNPRYRFSVPVQVVRKNGDVFTGELLDLAVAGCFIKLRYDLTLDEEVLLKFNVYGFDLQCQACAVWLAQSAVTHPKGIGCKFGSHSKSQKRALRAINRRLRKVSHHYRKFRYLMSPEDFLRNLEEIENAEPSEPRKTE